MVGVVEVIKGGATKKTGQIFTVSDTNMVNLKYLLVDIWKMKKRVEKIGRAHVWTPVTL